MSKAAALEDKASVGNAAIVVLKQRLGAEAFLQAPLLCSYEILEKLMSPQA